MDRALTRAQVARWRAAVAGVFLATGLSVATWAARVPAIKEAVGVDRAGLGLMLLAGGAASIVGLSLSAVIVARWGARRGMLGAMVVVASGVLVIGVGADLAHSWQVVTAGLVVWGLGVGTVDVAMNVEGAAIETQTGRTLLPLFHAFFSLGTVLGAGAGALAIGLGATVLPHVSVMIVLIVAVTAAGIPFVPHRETAMDPDAASPRAGGRERLHVALSAWKEPRTYALGVIMLGLSFAEGGANDWLPLAVVEGHGQGQAAGAAALAVFSLSMTVARVLGGPLVDRFGRVATLQVLAVLGAGGLLLFILAPNLPLALAGAALWGVGVSLGFPIGMSAAADDPAHAAARVSAAASIGYLAFLTGPPLLGFLSEHVGLLNTLYVLVALIVASGLASPAARPLAGARIGAGKDAAS